jgi:hypothetical protein
MFFVVLEANSISRRKSRYWRHLEVYSPFISRCATENFIPDILTTDEQYSICLTEAANKL